MKRETGKRTVLLIYLIKNAILKQVSEVKLYFNWQIQKEVISEDNLESDNKDVE